MIQQKDASIWRFSSYIPLGGDPGTDPELAGWIIYPLWSANALESVIEERDVRVSLLDLL